MNEKVTRTHCPKCGSPLSYDGETDTMFCECGYRERVKHDVNITNIVNNNSITATGSPSFGKSNAERDADFNYEKLVNKLIRYIDQEDDESLAEVQEELRREFPSSYFYSLLISLPNKTGVKLVLDAERQSDFIKYAAKDFQEFMNTGLDKEHPNENPKQIDFELLIHMADQLEKAYGVPTDDVYEVAYDKDGKKYKRHIDKIYGFYSDLLENLNAALKEKTINCIRYDVDKTNHEGILILKNDTEKFLHYLEDLYDKEQKWITNNYNKVTDVVNQAYEDRMAVLKENTKGKNVSGFTLTLASIILYFVPIVLFFPTIIYFLIHGSSSMNDEISATLYTLPAVGIPFLVAAIPVTIIARKRDNGYLSRKDIIFPIAALIATFISMGIAISSAAGIGYILGLAFTALVFVFSLIRLPKTISAKKEIKERKEHFIELSNAYLKERDEELQYTEYESIYDLFFAFHYNYSSWKF